MICTNALQQTQMNGRAIKKKSRHHVPAFLFRFLIDQTYVFAQYIKQEKLCEDIMLKVRSRFSSSYRECNLYICGYCGWILGRGLFLNLQSCIKLLILGYRWICTTYYRIHICRNLRLCRIELKRKVLVVFSAQWALLNFEN